MTFTAHTPSSSLWKTDAKVMAKLATAFAFVQFNITLTGAVDTALAGRAGAIALATCGLGSAFFMAVGVLVQGCGFGAEPFVAQALGAQQPREAQRWLWQGIYVSLLFSLPIWGIGYLGSRSMSHLGISPELAEGAHDYLLGRLPSLPLFGVMSALRAYLQACHRNRPVVVSAVVMNIANLLVNYVLLFGDAGLQRLGLPTVGMPTLGVLGLGLGSTLATVLQVVLLGVAVYRELSHTSATRLWLPQPARMRRLLALGVPVGLQMFAEVALFAGVGFLMGSMGAIAAAGHQAAIMLASCTFAMCVGVGNAVAVQVARAVGAADQGAQRRRGIVGLLLGCGIMGLTSVVMWVWPQALVSLMTNEPAVVAQATTLLRIAAVFQLVDGAQTVACGALRGLGKTRLAFLANVVAYWCIGFPTAYVLAIVYAWGPEGLWWGLVAGLATAAAVLVAIFWQASGTLVERLDARAALSL